jgi:hypothetical protein
MRIIFFAAIFCFPPDNVLVFFLSLRRENFKTLCRAYHSRPEMKPVALTTGSSLSLAIYAKAALSQPPDYAPE